MQTAMPRDLLVEEITSGDRPGNTHRSGRDMINCVASQPSAVGTIGIPYGMDASTKIFVGNYLLNTSSLTIQNTQNKLGGVGSSICPLTAWRPELAVNFVGRRVRREHNRVCEQH